MDAERWRRLEELFAGALERSAGERMAWLAAACADDAELRGRVEALLAQEHGSDARIAALVDAAAADTSVGRKLGAVASALVTGDRLGPHRLIREIGRGGMGVVYLAERADDAYRGQVAIKLVAFADEGVVRRFARERQILADLAHHNIARLLDGGTAPGGLPYIVMEHVEGRPIDEWCRERELSVADRLRLFVTTCEAVAHAHQRLVVHRDIKPANILVTSDGVVKLLDFGIASLLEPDASDAALTRGTARLLTPSHASPEQVRGAAVTTASDVYSLGVLLYVLLVDALPQRVDTDSLLEMERLVCEVVPPPPSAVAPESRRRLVRGDLDVIVMKALEKEPSRRYGSARELADDVLRHLESRPVRARPASWRYRLGRTLRRHRGLVAAAVVTAAALAAGTVVSTIAMVRARRDRQRAEREADSARAVTTFLQEMLTSVQPDKARGREVTVREILDGARARIGDGFADSPEAEAAIRYAIGDTYRSLGDLATARPMLERAVELRRASYGTDDQRTIDAIDRLGMVCWLGGDMQGSLRCSNELLAIHERLHGPESPDVTATLANLANTYADMGQLDKAEDMLRRTLSIERRTLTGPQREDLSYTLNNLATVLADQKKWDEATELHREALAIRRELTGADSPATIKSLANLGFALRGAGRLDEAEQALRESISLGETTLGAKHHDVARTRMTLASLLSDAGRHDEADAMARAAVASLAEAAGERSWPAGAARGVLGEVLLAAGRRDEARAELRQALAILEVTVGPTHARTVSVRDALARADAAPPTGG